MPSDGGTDLAVAGRLVDEDWQYRQPASPRAADFYRMPGHIRVELVDRLGQLPSVTRELQLVSRGRHGFWWKTSGLIITWRTLG